MARARAGGPGDDKGLISGGVHGIAGALFCIFVSLDDVNVALFLSSVRASPLSVRLFSYILQNADPLARRFP